jgi:uncharacterized membrane protein YjjP (DUF1212 family)
MDQQIDRPLNQQQERRPAPQRKERHPQVTVLAALAMLAGVIAVIIGIITLLTRSVFSLLAPPIARSPVVVILLGILTLIIGALYIAFSVGAWRLERWAWPLGMAAGSLAIIVNGVRLLYNLFPLVKGEPVSGIVGPVLALIVGGIILYYLFSDPVQRAFDL